MLFPSLPSESKVALSTSCKIIVHPYFKSCVIVKFISEIRLDFSEMEYRGTESSSLISIVVTKDLLLAHPVTIRIHPLTFERALSKKIINEEEYQSSSNRASESIIILLVKIND